MSARLMDTDWVEVETTVAVGQISEGMKGGSAVGLMVVSTAELIQKIVEWEDYPAT